MLRRSRNSITRICCSSAGLTESARQPTPSVTGPPPQRRRRSCRDRSARLRKGCATAAGEAAQEDRIVGQNFLAHVEQFSGAIIIIDNLGSYKGEAMRRAIRVASAKLFFLPPCIPDLKPIEELFAKLERCYLKPPSALSRPLGGASALLQCFTPIECTNYIKNAGYDSV
jgi:transposase